jgi:hypothetical protein
MGMRRNKATSTTKGMGLKRPPSHRVEVKALFPTPAPYGWQVYRRSGARPIEQSTFGYPDEAAAWTAGGAAFERIHKAARKAKMT